ncbi:hypothetical protein Plhal304r1_c074g0161921 [Plasmopara halstedii]
MSDGIVRQNAPLIISVHGFEKPLRALINTEMIIRSAKGSRMKMPKQVIRLAVKCEKFTW